MKEPKNKYKISPSGKTSSLVFLFIVFTSFLFLLFSTPAVDALIWNRPTVIQATLNVNHSETSNSSNFWDNLDTPADINHALLDNLEWSVAGHTIDGNIDMNDYNITSQNFFGNLIGTWNGSIDFWKANDNAEARNFNTTGNITADEYIITSPTTNWKIVAGAEANSIAFLPVATTGNVRWNLYSNSGSGENVLIDINGGGTPTDATGAHRLSIGYAQSLDLYQLNSNDKNVRFRVGGVTQMTLNTGGTTTFTGDVYFSEGLTTNLINGDGDNDVVVDIDGGGDLNINNVEYMNINGGMVVSENATFQKDVIIDGILYGGSPVKIAGINITNNLFSLEENRNSSSRFTLQNLNAGSNATTVIKTKNDVGGTMSIGIGSSNFIIGTRNYQNVTSLVSRSRGKMVFANFYNQSFEWLYNPSDDGDANNLEDIMILDYRGLNLTSGSIFLADFETSVQGGSKVVKRSNANGALFGIENRVPGANPTSGAGYITIADGGNYTVDLHSSLDTNNPNQVVHHLRGDIFKEIWRLDSGTLGGWAFEKALNDPVFSINATGEFVKVFAQLRVSSLEGTYSNGEVYVCVYDNGTIFAKDSACS